MSQRHHIRLEQGGSDRHGECNACNRWLTEPDTRTGTIWILTIGTPGGNTSSVIRFCDRCLAEFREVVK